jgi:DNA-binding FadR family transcriptional regulator
MAQEVEQDIVGRRLKAGARLGTKTDLREQYGVAVATVNEALRLLETRGLVAARPGPGGGVFVATPSAQVRLDDLANGLMLGNVPFNDCLAVRSALEPLVCREATRYCTPRDARAIRQIVDRVNAAASRPAELRRSRMALHRQLAGMCANALLKTLYLTLLDYVEEIVDDAGAEEVPGLRGNLEVHHEVLDAVVKGDSARLERALRRHAPTTGT